MKVNCKITSLSKFKECFLLWSGFLVLLIFIIPYGFYLGCMEQIRIMNFEEYFKRKK
jgi:hypothetical protein